MENHFKQQGASSKPEPIIISELQLNAVVRGLLFAVDVQTRPDKNGKSFRQLRLRDRRGNEIKVNQFDLPRIEPLAPQKGKIVLIEGATEEYQNKMQILFKI